MSALGQKRTCAGQKDMSALPLIATAKADSCTQQNTMSEADIYAPKAAATATAVWPHPLAMP
jgi:hypothetical protein